MMTSSLQHWAAAEELPFMHNSASIDSIEVYMSVTTPPQPSSGLYRWMLLWLAEHVADLLTEVQGTSSAASWLC